MRKWPQMARAFRLNDEDWLAEPTGWSHSAGPVSSTTIRFWRTDKSREVEGRVMAAPEDFETVSEEQLIAALTTALKR
jgi:hypothetical protein